MSSQIDGGEFDSKTGTVAWGEWTKSSGLYSAGKTALGRGKVRGRVQIKHGYVWIASAEVRVVGAEFFEKISRLDEDAMRGKVAHSRGRLLRRRCHDKVATGFTVRCLVETVKCSNDPM